MGRRRQHAIAQKRGDAQRDAQRKRERRCINKGGHWEDNQGRCHSCGAMIDPEKWAIYCGERLDYNGEPVTA